MPHIIRKLKLNEISGVDRPAQVGATVTLMKRAEPAAPDPKETIMFKTREELVAAIAKALGGTPTDAERTEIIKSATDLKLTDLVPTSITKAAAPATDPALLARLEKSEKISALNGVHKAHYDTLTTDDTRDTWLAKSASDRDAELAKAKGDDPVVYTTMDGMDIRKSAGDLVVSLAKRADETARQLVVEKASRLDEQLTKRADADIGKLAGTIDTRKALLKAVDGITNEATRAEVLKSLTAANTAMAAGFTKRGTTATDDTDVLKADEMTPEQAEAKLDELAKARTTADPKVSYHQAYDSVLDTAEGRALYKALDAN